MATPSPDMASEPLVSFEMHRDETESSNTFIDDIHEAVEVFVTTLSKIAADHKL